MSLAWETTIDDIQAAVQNKMEKDITRSEAEELLDMIDTDRVEDAALNGDDMEEQTEYAFEDIVKQIREGQLLAQL